MAALMGLSRLSGKASDWLACGSRRPRGRTSALRWATDAMCVPWHLGLRDESRARAEARARSESVILGSFFCCQVR